MEPLPGAPPWVARWTAAEQPELWQQVRAESRFASVWPEYNNHGNHTGSYFGAIFPQFGDLQVLLVDDRVGEVVARGRTIPFRWDGTLDDLPRGIDAVGRRAVAPSGPPTTLSALAAEVLPAYQGLGLSGLVLRSMVDVARRRKLGGLVAPVRPSRKDRFPRTPIDRYARWRRRDGLPFDPWLRTHERLGGAFLRAEPQSMEITHPVADWERWVGTTFPHEGDHVFAHGLAPLKVERGVGRYWEPNVWMLHRT